MELPKVGLIIDEPYISMILEGRKTWEMRSQRTGKRERIGLIKKGSSAVFGSIEVFDCDGPMSIEELKSTSEFHGITKQQIEMGLLDKWNYAWKLRDVKKFDVPIPYKHPSGAVTWVDLHKAAGISKIESPSIFESVAPKKPTNPSKLTLTPHVAKSVFNGDRQDKVPYAKDGTYFSPELSRSGVFTVGEKGAESKVISFEAALRYLQKMKVAKWRRPNVNGNWGIVSAVEWK
jgi:hypothetical protein